MNKIARMTAQQRADVFAETADRTALSEAIIEKTFGSAGYSSSFSQSKSLQTTLFKGGTSLSKIFHAIARFSEDIDLAVDYAALGFTGGRDPRQQALSKTRRAGILAEMMIECQRYIGDEFLNALTNRCQEILGADDTWEVGVSDQDPNVVRFRYPAASSKRLAYVAPQVVLELGTHAEFAPHDQFIIRSFVAEEFPELDADQQVRVVALLGKRTFWEK